jgi:hypothetical protein
LQVANPAAIVPIRQLTVRVFDYILRLLPVPPPCRRAVGASQARLRENASGAPRALSAPGSAWPEALIIAPWPEPMQDEGWEADNIAAFSQVQEVVRIRNLGQKT